MIKAYHSSLGALLNRWTTPPNPAGEDEIKYWQDKMLLMLLLTTVVLGLPVYVPSVALCIKESLWSIAVVDTAIYGWVVVLFFRRSLPFVVRATSVVCMSYVLGMVLLLTVGPFGAGPVWIFAFPVLAAVFMGVSTVFMTLAINAATLIAIGILLANGIVEWDYTVINPGEKWVVICLNFMLLNVIVAISVSYISKGLLISLKQKKNMLAELEQKHDQLLNFTRQLESEVIERRKVEGALRESEEKFSKAFRTSPYALIISRVEDGKIIETNDAFSMITGFTREEALNNSSLGLNLWGNREDRKKVMSDLMAGRRVASREYLFNRKNGGVITGLFSTQLMSLNNETCILSSINDITDLKQAEQEKAKLEEQFHQAQKLDSIGRLAGGVAHDLNNLLSPIFGYGEMLLSDAAGNVAAEKPLQQIVNAGKRARDLVRQLLAFSRKQALQYKNFDMNSLLRDFEKLLRRTIREDVSIRMNLAESLPLIKGDVGQLEQVVMNLAVNAQDAMPDGGHLTIETARVELDESYSEEHKGVNPGPYVMLMISDTGCGIDSSTREHLFEPFFTTKEKDKGTGLGLATVYGIVKQHGGNVWVYSEPGLGATFRVYLPVSTDSSGPDEADSKTLTESELYGSETILVVEDNSQVRNLARAILRRQGYKVLAAENGKEGISMMDQHEGPVHLLLTDVIMPDMNGKQLFERISQTYSDVKVLYMSGYTDNVIAHHGVIDPGVQFIQKPFSMKDLAAKVRETLDQGIK